MRPLIIFLSCFASMRYFYWRVSSTINLDSSTDATVSILLLCAEIYGLLILFLGYFQTIEVHKRTAPEPGYGSTVNISSLSGRSMPGGSGTMISVVD
jgi:hypothetical protein